MSSEERLDERTHPENKVHGVIENLLIPAKEDNVAVRPPSNMSSSSLNTEETLTAIVDTTLPTLAANDPSLNISFQPTPAQVPQSGQHEIAPMKASV